MAISSSRAELGRNFALFVDLAGSLTEGGEHWVRISRGKDASLSIGNEVVDASSKDDAGWSRDVLVRKTWSVQHSGQWDSGSASQELVMRLQNAVSSTHYELHIQLRDADGRRWVGWAVVESIDTQFSESELATISISLKGQGALERRIN